MPALTALVATLHHDEASLADDVGPSGVTATAHADRGLEGVDERPVDVVERARRPRVVLVLVEAEAQADQVRAVGQRRNAPHLAARLEALEAALERPQLAVSSFEALTSRSSRQHRHPFTGGRPPSFINVASSPNFERVLTRAVAPH